MKILVFRSFFDLTCTAGCVAMGYSTKDTKRTISIGSGGGATGLYTGFTVDKDGHFTRWSNEPGKAKIVSDLFTTTPDSAAFFFRYLDEISFTSKEFSTPGNMTTLIETDSLGTNHTVKWGNESVTAPCEFSNFYSMLKRFIDRHTK
mgnify:CR=1 FL=1